MSTIASSTRRTITDALVAPFFKRDHYYRWEMRGWLVAVLSITALGGVIFGIDFGAMVWDKSNTRAYCSTLNGRSGMRTEFIQTSAVDWDCYALTPTGKLVPTSQITYFVGKAK